jgi:hypothetical protein
VIGSDRIIGVVGVFRSGVIDFGVLNLVQTSQSCGDRR